MSNYKAIIPLGRMRIEITADTERGLFERVSFFAELPERCGNATCSSDKLRMRHRSPKGNDYYSLECAECGHEYTLGITKEDKRLFPHRKWEPPFTGGGGAHRDDEPRHETGRVGMRPAESHQGHRQTRDEDADLASRFPREKAAQASYPPSGGHGKAYGQR